MTRKELEQDYLDSYRMPSGCVKLTLLIITTIVIALITWAVLTN